MDLPLVTNVQRCTAARSLDIAAATLLRVEQAAKMAMGDAMR